MTRTKIAFACLEYIYPNIIFGIRYLIVHQSLNYTIPIINVWLNLEYLNQTYELLLCSLIKPISLIRHYTLWIILQIHIKIYIKVDMAQPNRRSSTTQLAEINSTLMAQNNKLNATAKVAEETLNTQNNVQS